MYQQHIHGRDPNGQIRMGVGTMVGSSLRFVRAVIVETGNTPGSGSWLRPKPGARGDIWPSKQVGEADVNIRITAAHALRQHAIVALGGWVGG